MDDHGIQLVRKIFKDMNIDKEWSVETDRGFTWWGRQSAQKIWAEQTFEDNGFHVTKVNAETDLLKYPTRSKKTQTILAIEMMNPFQYVFINTVSWEIG